MTRSSARYAIELIRELMASERYRVTGSASQGAGELGFDEDDIVACVRVLHEGVFYKCMQASRRPGYWQDVYHPNHGGIDLYVKVQIEGTDPEDLVVIISFKRR